MNNCKNASSLPDGLWGSDPSVSFGCKDSCSQGQLWRRSGWRGRTKPSWAYGWGPVPLQAQTSCLFSLLSSSPLWASGVERALATDGNELMSISYWLVKEIQQTCCHFLLALIYLKNISKRQMKKKDNFTEVPSSDLLWAEIMPEQPHTSPFFLRMCFAM